MKKKKTPLEAFLFKFNLFYLMKPSYKTSSYQTATYQPSSYKSFFTKPKMYLERFLKRYLQLTNDTRHQMKERYLND